MVEERPRHNRTADVRRCCLGHLSVSAGRPEQVDLCQAAAGTAVCSDTLRQL